MRVTAASAAVAVVAAIMAAINMRFNATSIASVRALDKVYRGARHALVGAAQFVHTRHLAT